MIAMIVSRLWWAIPTDNSCNCLILIYHSGISAFTNKDIDFFFLRFIIVMIRSKYDEGKRPLPATHL